MVKRIRHQKGKATSLDTSKGEVILGRAKLILAMSTLPSTTLMLDSFPLLPNIGQRFTGHFASYIFARVPCEGIFSSLREQATGKLEMAAIYIAGEDKETKHQFHLQLNAVAVGREPKDDDFDVMRNLLKTPKTKMLETCQNHVVFVCASLGQVDHNNPGNRFALNDNSNGQDKTSNGTCTLYVTLNNKDHALWTTMDDATFEVLQQLRPVSATTEQRIEYWNSVAENWQTVRPLPKQIRHECLVHPASTMWLGEDSDSAPVTLDYKIRGVDNVFLTGGALWPTGASWNPTCTMTALAMDLADRLSCKPAELESKL